MTCDLTEKFVKYTQEGHTPWKWYRLLLQLRIESSERAIWRILKNIRQYLTILYNIAQYWAIFRKIWKYLTISSNIVSHLISQKQTYAIPKFSVPLFFFTWASSRGARAPKNNEICEILFLIWKFLWNLNLTSWSSHMHSISIADIILRF